MGTLVPDEFEFKNADGVEEGLYRGDTYVFTHYFNDEPPDWAASTAYTLGNTIHEAGESYVANTTCTHLGKTYTCTTAHTSGATFDATKWTEDAQALGPASDFSDCTFLGQYRTDRTTTGTLLASDSFDTTDADTGIVVQTLTAAQCALLVPVSGKSGDRVYWDMQVTLSDDTTVKTLLWGRPKILGDMSRVVAP